MKILDPFSLNKPVCFDYFGSIDEGVHLLSQFVAPLFEIRLKEGWVGKIKSDYIYIRFYRPGYRLGGKNILFPAFVGKFAEKNGKTILTGELSMSKITKYTLIAGIFLTIIFWIYVAISDHHTINNRSDMTVLIVACILNISFLIIWPYFCISGAKKEMQLIEDQIRKVLTEGHV